MVGVTEESELAEWDGRKGRIEGRKLLSSFYFSFFFFFFFSFSLSLSLFLQCYLYRAVKKKKKKSGKISLSWLATYLPSLFIGWGLRVSYWWGFFPKFCVKKKKRELQ